MRFWLFVPGLTLALSGMAHGQTDHFAGNDRVSLHVQITLDGSDRKDLPNGVEWFAITAHRELDLTYSLVDVGMDGVPIVGGVREGAVSDEMKDLEASLAECGENQICLAGVMMQFAQSGQGGTNPFEAMTGMQPGRYRNFAGDRAGTCAEGRVVVSDVLEGVVIPPPNPAVAYNFTRKGQLDLPQSDASMADGICGAEVTLDVATGAVSLRLPLGAITVPVTMGPGAFTHESGVAFAEGNATVELLDQASSGTGAFSGETPIRIGSASHNSGQVGAGLSGRLHWSLVVE
ncbi:hypothetical protein [Devosia sediminis]|uniref:Uncharacterized protein n=1 Tax=Devosia sediminis TaxID=2798801 RepID=A0A934IRC6_9HYPH|nr:hypothetical protein [Devosia sediminis]MBJ3783771.1 hypothetical protein [Devosia sediminis]